MRDLFLFLSLLARLVVLLHSAVRVQLVTQIFSQGSVATSAIIELPRVGEYIVPVNLGQPTQRIPLFIDTDAFV